MVYAAHGFVGGFGDDGAAAVAPESGEGKQGLVGKLEVVGLSIFPFVEAVGGNEATVAAKQVFKGGSFVQGFGAGVDDQFIGGLEPPCGFFCAVRRLLPNDGDGL